MDEGLTRGQAQGSGKEESLFLQTLRELRDLKQCRMVVDKLVSRLSDTSNSSSFRRPIQLVSRRRWTPSRETQTQIRGKLFYPVIVLAYGSVALYMSLYFITGWKLLC